MSRAAQRIVLALVKGYQATLGRILGGNCRFHPTCSDYAREAIEMNGALVGGGQALWRIARCGPWSKGGVEHPRPWRRRARAAGDARG